MALPKRIMIKLSGEMLHTKDGTGVIDPRQVTLVAEELLKLQKKVKEIVVVVGAGNIIRGAMIEALGASRVQGDYMGMLATVINGMALQDAISSQAGAVKLLTTFTIPQVADTYTPREALSALAKKQIVICAGGTGNPYFTTDTTAALRGIELECELLVKGTKVRGVYDKDPTKHDDAVFLPTLSFDDAIEKNLRIMDQTAFTLCKDNAFPIKVGQMNDISNISKLALSDKEGSLIS